MLTSTFWMLAPEKKQASKAFPIWSPEEIFHRSADFDPIASPQESASENKADFPTMPSTKPPKWVEIRWLWVFNIFLHIRGKENLQTLMFPSCLEVQTLSDIQLCVDSTTLLPKMEGVESFIWICLKIFPKPAIKTTTKLQES